MSPAVPHQDILEVARDVAVRSDVVYTFRGETRNLANQRIVPVSEAGSPLAIEPGRPLLLALLESEIYQRAYRRPADGVGRSVVEGGADGAFIERLSQANTGSGTWEPGWHVADADPDGMIGARRDAVVCWLPPVAVRTGDGRAAAPGAAIQVRVPKEIRHLVLGYYLALGDAAAVQPFPGTDVVRVYWNLTPEGAVEYIRRMTMLLNAERIPFRTKVVAHSRMYGNADSGVLYLAKPDFARSLDAVRAVHAALGDQLRPAVPMFSRRLAPGVGLGEDPGDGTSFGNSRSHLAARGLWQAHAAGAADAEGRACFIAQSFADAGLDPFRPHLRSGADHDDDLD
jgi:hypothetical protein